MADLNLNSIIKGLECCSSSRGTQGCYGCPYAFMPEDESSDYDCSNQLLKDAARVLKAVQNERTRA